MTFSHTPHRLTAQGIRMKWIVYIVVAVLVFGGIREPQYREAALIIVGLIACLVANEMKD